MSHHLGTEMFDSGRGHPPHLRPRLRDQADSGLSASSSTAALIHGALAAAYAGRSGDADGRSWIAANRLW
jgi:hypothetical protein